MAQVSPVMGRLTAIEQNRERLASLGTMAAGLAHELNNPAAAAKRSSAELGEALEVLTSAVSNFVEAGVSREVAAQLVELQREALSHAAACTVLDTLDAADAEDELAERLEDLGVLDAYRLAEPLAAARHRRRLAGPRRGRGRTGGRRRGRVGRRVAGRALADRRAGRLDRPHQQARRRGQVLRLHGPR